MEIRTLYKSGDEYLNSFYNNKGVLAYSNAIVSTALKRVNTGDVIKYNGSITNTAIYMVIFDNDLNFVKSINKSDGYTYTVLSGECYVGFNIDGSSIHSTSVKCECENVDYLSSPHYVEEIIFAQKDGDNVIDNAYINGNNGNQITLNGTSCSDYLNVGTLNKIQIASCYGNVNNGAFYNANKEFIVNLGTSNTLITLDVPNNAEFLRVSCNSGSKSTYVIGYTLKQQSGGEEPELPEKPELPEEPDTPIIPPTNIDSIPNLNSGLYVDCSKISYNNKSLKLIIDLLLGGVN